MSSHITQSTLDVLSKGSHQERVKTILIYRDSFSKKELIDDPWRLLLYLIIPFVDLGFSLLNFFNCLFINLNSFIHAKIWFGLDFAYIIVLRIQFCIIKTLLEKESWKLV